LLFADRKPKQLDNGKAGQSTVNFSRCLQTFSISKAIIEDFTKAKTATKGKIY
jgi:hypothetical protein